MFECVESHFLFMAAEEHLNAPPPPLITRTKYIDIKMVYLIVSGAVIVPFTSSAWFCDVTVYFIPSTWTCVR